MITKLSQILKTLSLDPNLYPDEEVNLIPAFDSRTLANASSCLFFAFGPKGHESCHDAYIKGCRYFVCEYLPNIPTADSKIFLVPNTLQALHQMASQVRDSFTQTLIGITGSNGKTVVKEWISQFLAPKFFVTKNPGSYNSQIGVPISLLLLNSETEVGIFEAGISKPNEMETLANMMKPNIGIFTFLGVAHEENFASKQELLAEKIKLFKSCSTIIVESNTEAENLLRATYLNAKIITVSNKDLKANFCLHKNGKEFTWYEEGNLITKFLFHRNDDASALNLALSVAAARIFGADLETINKIIPQLTVPIGRLRLQNGINNCKIINDSYVADLASLKIALEELNQLPQNFSRTLILSDFPTQIDSEKMYKDVVSLCNQYHPNKVILIGTEIRKHAEVFTGFSTSYASTEDAIHDLNRDSFSNEAILIKGARSFELEKIAAILEEQNHECFLEINLDAISNNVKAFRSKLHSDCKLMVMVKAFSYGTGSVEMGRHLEYLGIDYLAVAYADEGVELRKAGIKLPIMVMSPETPSFSAIRTYNLEPEIYSFRTLDFIIKDIENSGSNQPISIHLKIDTGMHRLGFMPEEIDLLIPIIKAYPNLKIASIFTHLVAAEDENMDDFSLEQIRRFKSASHKIIDAIGYRPLLHFQNSSGITRFQDPEATMARLGIGMYGYNPDPAFKDELKEAITFKTVISAIREISEPETVGYNRKGIVKGTMKIATISVGYADGFSRKLGLGNYEVKIGEYNCKTIGSVCMDMCMVDVTNIPCSEGDEVILFSPTHSIDTMANTCGTIPYEILTGIGQRVKRIYVKE